MEIERLWGQEPGWFAEQEEEERTRLLAWYRVHLTPSGAKKPSRRPQDPRTPSDGDAPNPHVQGSASGRSFWLGEGS